jgi:hypothetical protein
MRQINGLVALVPVLVSALLGCSGTTDETTENVGRVSSPLAVQTTRLGVSSELMPVDGPFPAGIAASEDLIFTGSPFEGRVIAHARDTHATVGELPSPPGGFILPFILKSVKGDKVAVLDAGGFPSPKPFIPASPTIYEYRFRYRHGVFNAELTRSIPFAGNLIGFSEDAIQLDDGRYLLDDAVLGSIWIANTDGTIVPGIVPKTFDAADVIPQMFFCDTMPQIVVGGLPFLFTASTVPGITSMTTIKDTLYFSGSCSGAVYSVPLKVLNDHRQPYQRAADLRVVSRRPAGVQVEELLGLTSNPFDHDDRYLYAADALQLRVIRIDPRNGKREVVGDDQHLFNFPSSLAFAPPTECESDEAPLLTLSNQQHRTPITNDAVTQDTFQPPFLATQTFLKD